VHVIVRTQSQLKAVYKDHAETIIRNCSCVLFLVGKELMTPDELAVMDNGKCILQVQGGRPFFSDKYDITKHPQYKYLSDADKRNTFDVAGFLKHRLRVKPEDKFEVYETEV